MTPRRRRRGHSSHQPSKPYSGWDRQLGAEHRGAERLAAAPSEEPFYDPAEDVELERMIKGYSMSELKGHIKELEADHGRATGYTEESMVCARIGYSFKDGTYAVFEKVGKGNEFTRIK